MRSFSQKPNYWNFWHTQIIFKAGNLRLEPSWGVCGWQQARESLTADGEILIGVMPIPSLGGVTILRHLSNSEDLVSYTVTFWS